MFFVFVPIRMMILMIFTVLKLKRFGYKFHKNYVSFSINFSISFKVPQLLFPAKLQNVHVFPMILIMFQVKSDTVNNSRL